ncbi:VOC family protein [Alicyclobacillus tolerans]|uniref:VOC family protein n=1 Tax=Alicyclobacillus tolerans TaxID=90970 RepID=UPI003B7ED5CF
MLAVISQSSTLIYQDCYCTYGGENSGYSPARFRIIIGKHLAFEVDFDDIEKAETWLKERGISVAQHGEMPPTKPYARPHSRNASVYFNDPDGNNLEFICNLPDGPTGLTPVSWT